MINPIFSASMRRRMRSFRTILLILLYALLPLCVAFSRGFALGGDTLPLEQLTSIHQFNSFYTLFLLQFILTLLVAPAMTAGTITGENERQTMDMLLVTNTGSFSIVMGKWMEAFAFLALLIISALPMSAMVLALAGMNALIALPASLYLMVCAFSLSALGMICSALCRRTIASTVTAYIILFALGILFMLAIIYNESAMDVNAPDFYFIGDKPVYWFNFLNPLMGFSAILWLLMGEVSASSWGNRCDPWLFIILHIALLLAISLGLAALSALLLRPRSRRRKGKKTA